MSKLRFVKREVAVEGNAFGSPAAPTFKFVLQFQELYYEYVDNRTYEVLRWVDVPLETEE